MSALPTAIAALAQRYAFRDPAIGDVSDRQRWLGRQTRTDAGRLPDAQHAWDGTG